jgi:hypothetical protein
VRTTPWKDVGALSSPLYVTVIVTWAFGLAEPKPPVGVLEGISAATWVAEV